MTTRIRAAADGDASAVRELVARAITGAEHSAPRLEADGVPGEVTLLAWLGESVYYARFGFVPAASVGLVAEPQWGDFFEACVLGGHAESVPRGGHTYAEPFSLSGWRALGLRGSYEDSEWRRYCWKFLGVLLGSRLHRRRRVVEAR